MGCQLKQHGLTLIEVMIAVLILSLVMVGVTMSSSFMMRSMQRIQDRTLAMWVADLVEVDLNAGIWGVVNSHSSFAGDQVMGQKTWHWVAQAQPFNEIIRVDIGILEAGKTETILTKQAYVAQP